MRACHLFSPGLRWQAGRRIIEPKVNLRQFPRIACDGARTGGLERLLQVASNSQEKAWRSGPTQMIELIPLLRRHLDPLEVRSASFLRHAVNLEGWFKGELLVALDTLSATGAVAAFDREVRMLNSRIDLVSRQMVGSIGWS